jgi:hypothetical protein
MPAFEMTANLYTLDEDSLEEVMEIFSRSCAVKAIRAFLKATTRRIPVRTGFLRGAFKEIERAFGSASEAQLNPALAELFGQGGKLFKELEAAFDKKRPSSKKAGEKRAAELQAAAKKREALKNKEKGLRRAEYYYDGKRKVLKTTTSGIPFATPPEQVYTSTGNTFRIFIDVAISYYRVNDFSGRIRGAPWGSLDAGSAALTASLQKSVSNFPEITEILGTVKIALRGTSITKNNLKPDVQNIKSKLLRITGFD